jgi:sulfite exporter TauE/SafE
MITLSLAAAFLLGLASTMHCIAMCGGIIAALSLGLTSRAGMTASRRALLVAGFSAGRVASYAIAGVIAGSLGTFIVATAGDGPAYTTLQLLAAATLVLIGLQLAGWFPGISVLEAAGSRVWRKLQPVGAAFLPVDNLPKALVVGGLWGWLPCGLVYSTLLWVSARADPVFGGTAMAAFGLGTLPGMTVTGLAAHRLSSPARLFLRRVSAALIIVFGLASGYIAIRDGAPPGTEAQHVHG